MGKKLPPEPESDDLEIPTSMIDVVFLLLIFFIVATRIVVPEEKLDATLPKDEGPSNAPPPVDLVMPISVVVLTNNAETGPIIKIGTKTFTNFNDVSDELAKLHNSSPESPVEISGGRRCFFGYILATIDACATNKITNVKFMGPANFN